MISTAPSNITAPTRYATVGDNTYAYRQFGSGPGLPLLFLQHFTGTLDNWDPAVIDQLASDREVILFDNAGIGRSTGTVPPTVAGMATHTFAFLDALGLDRCEVLGFSREDKRSRCLELALFVYFAAGVGPRRAQTEVEMPSELGLNSSWMDGGGSNPAVAMP